MGVSGAEEAAEIPALILFGPTATGKTELLERLFGGNSEAEIISADSMQVYRGMDIGTAKPPVALRAALPHHLIDIRDPREQFNAGEFVRLAQAAIEDIRRRGKLPVVSGGTGFYLNNLVQGLPAAPPSDPAIRAVLRQELEDRGAAALREELACRDPVSAGRIHYNDVYRLLRALEVFRQTGRPLSSCTQTGRAGPRYRFLILGIDRDRDEVYRRINERCAQMFREGLAEEVKRLWEAGCGPADPGMRAIGYREFFVEPEPGVFSISSDTKGVEALTARNSRRYAKRQFVYFASLPGAKWIKTAADIRRELAAFLAPPPAAGIY
ncbi:MAG: tRNA (adenosine(37)-N6)-dimethylallyltransferase MiaA [Treponema sp.]|jgi:tRNA dimethylallyltransferase|nr:tRNA (adenosine(37)-N6)-dimethylallyltransferase MiaA [Treponema sp.]